MQAVFAAEKLAAVAHVIDLGLDTKVEILEVASFSEQMAGLLRKTAGQNAILDCPIARLIGMRLPAFQVLAVEELDPAGLVGFQGQDADCEDKAVASSQLHLETVFNTLARVVP